jgi:hypothetical protein
MLPRRHMLLGRSGGLVGSRMMPIEDVPDDAFDRRLEREVDVAPWQHALASEVLSIYAPGRDELRIKRARPRGAGVFGGRWLPHAIGIVVYTHGDRDIEKGVLLHEICHYLRWLYVGDEPGYHNEGFLCLVEDVYRAYGVPCATAKTIEGQYPETWNW